SIQPDRPPYPPCSRVAERGAPRTLARGPPACLLDRASRGTLLQRSKNVLAPHLREPIRRLRKSCCCNQNSRLQGAVTPDVEIQQAFGGIPGLRSARLTRRDSRIRGCIRSRGLGVLQPSL